MVKTCFRRCDFLPKCAMILIFCLISCFHANSQTGTDSSSNPSIESIRLIGAWNSIDSLHEKIEFVEDWYEVTLKIPGDHPYYFLKDSLGNTSSSGFYPLWPPPSCNLYFISKDTLQVSYGPFGGQGVSVLYVKRHP